jgi:hypothetical protein
VKQVDKFFADHKAFMDKTHPTSGDAEPRPLMYIVTKAPEPKDPNNPKAGSTGNTLYSLTETYRGMDGCTAHMAAGQADGPLFSKFLEIVSKYASFQSMMAEVVHTMDDPLSSALADVKRGCRAFNLGFKVPDADVECVDEFFANHKAFMEEAHHTSGNAEPRILFYTVTKTPEPKDSNNPAAGSTGNTLYALTEIYRGMKDCEAHMAAGQATFTSYRTWPPPARAEHAEDGGGPRHQEKTWKMSTSRGNVELFPTFLDIVDKYAVHQSMMVDVVHTMK